MRTKNILSILCIATGLLASCSSEEVPVNGFTPKAEAPGEITTATFRISIDPALTRGPGPMAHDQNEIVAQNTVHLLIFDADATTLEADSVFDVRETGLVDFTLQTTTGPKRVYAVVAGQRADYYTSSYLYYFVRTSPLAAFGLGYGLTELWSLMVDLNGILTNSHATNSAFTLTAEGNDIDLTVERPVAKVLVYYDRDDPDLMNLPQGTLFDPMFRLSGVNRSMYIFRQATTPNAGVAEPEAASYFYNDYYYDYVYGSLEEAAANNTVYVPENIPATTFEGNRTCLEMNVEYLPKLQYVIGEFDFAGGNFTHIAPPAEDTFMGGTLYYIRVQNGEAVSGFLFIDRDLACKFAYILKEKTDAGFNPGGTHESDGLVKTFTDGRFPFRIYFDSNEKNAPCKVERNHFYIVKITDLSKIEIANVQSALAIPSTDWQIIESEFAYNP